MLTYPRECYILLGMTPLKHPGGRPRIYQTPEDMQPLIDDYFEKTKIWTIPGICYHLGFDHRHALADYAEQYPEFSATINRARLKIELQRNERLVDGDTKNVNGMKFDLTNNFGWVEKTETDNTHRFPNAINWQIVKENERVEPEASAEV